MGTESIAIETAFSEKEKLTDVERVEQFFHYLTGTGLPDGVQCQSPKLKPKKAFSVIWFLQEIAHALPSNVEMCSECGSFYDSHSEGYYVNDEYKKFGYKKREQGKCFCGACHDRRA